MRSEAERNMLALGGKRDKGSGGWTFPVHPKEKERNKKMKELDSELEEVRKLKKELIELKNNLTDK